MSTMGMHHMFLLAPGHPVAVVYHQPRGAPLLTDAEVEAFRASILDKPHTIPTPEALTQSKTTKIYTARVNARAVQWQFVPAVLALYIPEKVH